MAKEEVAEQQEESKPWWAIDKAAWKERLSGFYRLASIADGRDAPLRRWSDADVEEFMNTDPVYGPQVIFISSFFFFSLFLAFIAASDKNPIFGNRSLWLIWHDLFFFSFFLWNNLYN